MYAAVSNAELSNAFANTHILNNKRSLITFYAAVSNAELSNAFASTAWELVALQNSYHPDLAKGGVEVCTPAPLPYAYVWMPKMLHILRAIHTCR